MGSWSCGSDSSRRSPAGLCPRRSRFGPRTLVQHTRSLPDRQFDPRSMFHGFGEEAHAPFLSCCQRKGVDRLSSYLVSISLACRNCVCPHRLGRWSPRGRGCGSRSQGRSTGEPKSLGFWLEAGPEDRGVHRLLEAVAHVRGAPIFDVQVELAHVRKKEVYDPAIVHELPSR